MLRAMLVDDEPLALEGLKLLINWQAEGFEICGECASACEALRKLPDANPDLIVTDIRMPGMSGLELLHAARQAGFDGQFVIVSGYSDFQYAKKALQLGVAGYLLKPVEPADAAVVLAHVRRKLIGRETESEKRQNTVHRAIGAMLTQGGAPEARAPQVNTARASSTGAGEVARPQTASPAQSASRTQSPPVAGSDGMSRHPSVKKPLSPGVGGGAGKNCTPASR